jgi:hypothetical protein
VSDDERVERAVRAALRDAAEQVEARVPSPGDRPGRRADRGRRLYQRAPLAVTAGLLTVAVLVAVFVLTGRTDEDTVATGPSPPEQVEPTELGLDEADLVVMLATGATADQLATVREAIASSPDVVRFTEAGREQTARELIEAVCRGTGSDDMTGEGLRAWASGMLLGGVGGVGPSFLVVIGDGDGADMRLRDSLARLPGVTFVAAPGPDMSVPADPSVRCLAFQGGDPPPDPGPQGDVPATPGRPPPTTPLPPPPTVAPTLPTPSGEEPADPEAARAAIVEAYTTATDGSLTAAERRVHIEDSDELGPYLDRAAAPYRDAVRYQTVTLGDITFIDAERAALVYTLSFGGRLAPQTDVGYAVLDDGRWKVSRETVCALILRAGVTCPPRAES